MQLTHFVAAGLAPALVSAFSRRVVDCTFSVPASAGDTCETLAGSWGLDVETLQQLNPGITCPDLDTSKTYCVIGTVTDEPGTTLTTSSWKSTTTTTTTTTTKSTTTTTTTAPSNSPTMPGFVNNCDGFYKVSSGDQCDTIAKAHGITTAQLLSWNNEINDSCSNLWMDYYICVHVPGTTTSSSSPELTKDPSGPTPQLPGSADNCDGFYQVSSSDSCDSIARANGISTTQFKEWSTAIDENCTNLWLDHYVCVHVPGATTSTTTSLSPELTSGPTPQMPGVVSNCKSYHLIADGDSCWSIYTAAGITLAQLRQWNTQLDASCSNLWLGYYICIGV
ncbi:uncharacterized protein BDW70DRAFT_162863 [Aspergillus foveolatus]|uniref:uncharacterized protein n=1 Tax=Aspergillus foveolatus TaxID=210207 RepID=UPI003CCD7BED